MIQNLAQAPICRGLSQREVATIFELAEAKTAPPGDWLFREGEEGDGLFVVVAGEVEVVKQAGDGRMHELARVGTGGVVGEMSLLGEQTSRAAGARTVSETKVLKLPASRFSQLLKSEDIGALKMVHNLARVLSQRVALMNQKLIERSQAPARTEEFVEFERILTRWAF